MKIIIQRVTKAQVSIEAGAGENQPRPLIAGWCWTRGQEEDLD